MSRAQSDDCLRAYSDIAMYAAKESGKNAYVFFDATLKQKIVERNLIEQELQNALDAEAFDLNFQPKFESSTMTVNLLAFAGMARRFF